MRTKEEIFSIIKDLKGWCDADKAHAVYRYVREYKPERGLEIGMFNGRSYFPAAVAMSDNGKGVMIGLDPMTDQNQQQYNLDGTPRKRIQFDWEEVWQDTVSQRDRILEVHDIDISNHIEMHRLASFEFIKNFDDELDYLHIDGNHSYKNVLRDLEEYYSRLRSGGLLCMDDLAWPTVGKAWKEFRAKNPLTNLLIKPNWGFFLKK